MVVNDRFHCIKKTQIVDGKLVATLLSNLDFVSCFELNPRQVIPYMNDHSRCMVNRIEFVA